jgi:hypothetical protein
MDYWLQHFKPILSATNSVSSALKTFGRGPEGRWMRMKTTDHPLGNSTLISATRSTYKASTVYRILTLNYERLISIVYEINEKPNHRDEGKA